MSTVRIPRESIEKLQCRVTAPTDPTGDTVSFAFAAEDARPDTFTAGTWDGTYSGGYATAVTPTVGFTDSGATVELAAGTWIAYVKVTDSPEVPVRKCGSIVIE